MKKKTPALTMLKEGVSIAHIAADLHVSKRAISDLKQAATGLPDNTMPIRKTGTGMKKRTTDGTTHTKQHRSKRVQPNGSPCANNHCSTRYEQSFRHNKHTHTNQKAATDKHSRHNH